jgi:hypothetical protein
VSGRVSTYDAVSGQLKDPDPANGDVTAICFMPDPETGLVLETRMVIASPYNYAFAAVPVGPRVIRAYQAPAGTPVAQATIKSMPVRLLVQHGGQTKDLVIR